MSKKLSGNGLWESSRMMLPQHKERIKADQKEELKKRKPILHEDEWEIINHKMLNALQNKSFVLITVFGEYENKVFCGVVNKIDFQNNHIQIQSDIEAHWIPIMEIVDVESHDNIY